MLRRTPLSAHFHDRCRRHRTDQLPNPERPHSFALGTLWIANRSDGGFYRAPAPASGGKRAQLDFGAAPLGRHPQPKAESSVYDLGPGEREAIALAIEEGADFLLMDETKGRKTAVEKRIAVKGTLGVLEEAAEKILIALPEALASLKATGIFLSEKIIQDVFDRHRRKQ